MPSIECKILKRFLADVRTNSQSFISTVAPKTSLSAYVDHLGDRLSDGATFIGQLLQSMVLKKVGPLEC